MATGLTGSAFADTNVVNGQTYFYTVTAINPALRGESPPSVEASAKPVYVTTSTAYQCAMLAAAPAVWWRLNETNGALLYDAIGNNNGTNAGAVVLGAAGPRPPDFLGFEMTNTAAQFANGTSNAWINVPALNLNTNTVTITAWIYPFSTMADYAGVCFYRSGGTVAGINYGGSFGANTGMIGYTVEQRSKHLELDFRPDAVRESMVICCARRSAGKRDNVFGHDEWPAKCDEYLRESQPGLSRCRHDRHRRLRCHRPHVQRID